MRVDLMRRVGAVVAVVAALALMAGCGGAGSSKVEPKVAPPAISAEGVLKAGVDLSQPPFAGEDDGKQAGYDIDVAAALADRLGLKVEYVDVKPSDAATALAQGTCDVVLSVPLADGATLTQIALAGSYYSDGPAFFISTGSTASVEPSITLDTVRADSIGAQEGSESFWLIRSEFGSESVGPYDSLRAAIEALDAQDIPLVAGDAWVGAYIIRDFPNVHFAGEVRPAQPVAIAVAADNTELSDLVRTELDGLAADGVLSALRRKWVGDLPALTGETAADSTATPAAEATTTP